MKVVLNSKFCVFYALFLTVFSLMDAQIIDVPQEHEFEIEYITPERIVKLGEGHYFIDFGKAYFGTLALHSSQAQNDNLIVRLGEKLKDENHIDRLPGGTIRYQQVMLDQLKANEDVVIALPADKRNTKSGAIHLPESFGVIIPFRYCELENLQVPIEELEISQKAFYYEFNDEAGTFTSSDTVLNAVWDLCKHTVKATTFTGYYVDGDRERIPYEADAYINQLSHYSCDNSYAVARRTNEYFVKHPTWPTEWLLHTVLLYYQDYMYTGETEMLEEYYDVLKMRTLMDLEGEDGLISSKSPKLNGEFKLELGFKKAKTNVRDIVDWPAGQKDTGWKLANKEGERDGYEMVAVNTVVNAFYYYNLVLMTEIADALGKTEDASFFQKKSKKLKKVINKQLFDKTRGVYIDGAGSTHASLHANMFPLAFGLVPEKNVETVVDFIKTRGMACSVYGAQYLLDGLFNANEADYALELITDTTHDRTWWNMIEIGSTMALEAWDMKYKPNSDWNHAWGTAPLNVITRQMWGVTPKTPGFASVQIKPQMGNLQSSEIRVPTIRGGIEAKYSVTDDNYERYDILLPDGMSGNFVLVGDILEVQLNGNILKKNTEVVKLEGGVFTLLVRR